MTKKALRICEEICTVAVKRLGWHDSCFLMMEWQQEYTYLCALAD